MKKLTLIFILIAVVSFLTFGLVCSQPEQTPGSADSTSKDTIKTPTTKAETPTSPADTTKKITPKQETAVKDTTKAVTKVVNKYIGTAKCKMCHNSEAKG